MKTEELNFFRVHTYEVRGAGRKETAAYHASLAILLPVPQSTRMERRHGEKLSTPEPLSKFDIDTYFRKARAERAKARG